MRVYFAGGLRLRYGSEVSKCANAKQMLDGAERGANQ